MAAKKRRSNVSANFVVLVAVLGAAAGSIIGNILIALINKPWFSQLIFIGGQVRSENGDAADWIGGIGQTVRLVIQWSAGENGSYVLYFHALSLICLIAAIVTYLRLKRN